MFGIEIDTSCKIISKNLKKKYHLVFGFTGIKTIQVKPNTKWYKLNIVMNLY